VPPISKAELYQQKHPNISEEYENEIKPRAMNYTIMLEPSDYFNIL
jgi:hypothetical protein